MAVIRRKKSSSNSAALLGCCCGLCRCLSQFVVALTWGLALGVLLAVHRHAASTSSIQQHDNTAGAERNMAVAAAAPLPVGPDGLPSLSALLERQRGLRGGVDTTAGGGGVADAAAPQQDQQIQSNNAALNPNNCPLPSNSKIVEIPTNGDFDFKLAVWSDGDFLSDTIATKKAWEIESVDDMAALAASNALPTPDRGAFYDIGANVGYYTFLFAAAGYPSVAVEPDPGNAALLRASACLNRDRLKVPVRVRQVALTSAAEIGLGCRLAARVVPRTQKYLHATPRLFCPAPAEPCDPGRDKICVDSVPVATFRQLLLSSSEEDEEAAADNNSHSAAPALPAPAIVKIDVEGHEMQVLQGMLEPGSDQRQWPHTIQFENKDHRVADALQEMLEAAGYTVGLARGHDQNTVAERPTAATTGADAASA